MTKPTKPLITIVAIACISFCSCQGCKEAETTKGEAYTDTLPALITQVQKCSRLHTAEYDIHKIVTYDDVVRMKGSMFNRNFDVKLPIGDRKIAIPMDVKLKAYIDFSGFSEKNIERDGKKITVILPDPKVVLASSKIDHAGTKEYVALTRSRFTDAEMAAFEQQGRQSVIDAIPQMGIIETSRKNAARVLIPMIEQLGYAESDITITFRKDLKAAYPDILLDKSTIER